MSYPKLQFSVLEVLGGVMEPSEEHLHNAAVVLAFLKGSCGAEIGNVFLGSGLCLPEFMRGMILLRAMELIEMETDVKVSLSTRAKDGKLYTKPVILRLRERLSVARAIEQMSASERERRLEKHHIFESALGFFSYSCMGAFIEASERNGVQDALRQGDE
jgi:hypothetical protein